MVKRISAHVIWWENIKKVGREQRQKYEKKDKRQKIKVYGIENEKGERKRDDKKIE
jgi:hypothetical protein